MSITFSLSGNAPQVKVYTKDRFPSLDDSDFEGEYGYERDEVGLYFMESAWLELTWANANAYAMLNLLGLPVECYGCVVLKDLSVLRQYIIRMLNTSVPNLRESISIDSQPRKVIKSVNGTERVIQEGNCGIYDPGLCSNDVIERLQWFLKLIVLAQEQNRDICWG
jgi:hypothetical protein